MVGLYLPLLLALLGLQLLVAVLTGGLDNVTSVSLAVLAQLVLPSFVGTYLVAGAQSAYLDLIVRPGDWSMSASLASLRPVGAALGHCALLAVTLALMVSFIPFLGLFYFALWGPPVIVSAVVLERVRLGEAWSRTQPRMRGNWGRGLLLLGASALMSFAVPLVVAASAAFALSSTGWGFWIYAVTLGVLDAVAFPWLAAVTLLLYFDVRVRGEGFDLDQLRHARTQPPTNPS